MTGKGRRLSSQLSRRPDVMHGKLVVAGSRVLVASIVRLHEDGYGIGDILREYPDLSRDGVEAALRYGRRRGTP